MKLSFTKKFVCVFVAFLLISSGITYFVATYNYSKTLTGTLSNNIIVAHENFAAITQSKEDEYAHLAKIGATNSALIQSIVDNNYAQMQNLAQNFMADAHANLLTITDAKGNVLVRAHSENSGDAINSQETVAKALQGTTASAVVLGKDAPFSLRASAPIVYNNEVIGTFSIGSSLSNPEYLDWLGNLLHVQVTFFYNAQRVMTTIQNDKGERIIGTSLNNPTIENHVLREGNVYFGESNIIGEDYLAAYWPAKTYDGKIIGMWFIGLPVSDILQAEVNANRYTLISTVGVILILLIFAIIVSVRFVAPIKVIANYASNVADGKDDIMLEIKGNDEFATLATALKTMVEKLKEQTQISEATAENVRLMVVNQVESVVIALDDATHNLKLTTESAEKNAQNTADRMLEVNTSIEEMEFTIQSVAQNASQAAVNASDSQTRAQEGQQIVQEVVNSFKEVQNYSTHLKNNMNELSVNANNITRIVNVIRDIADQTNLLALNAAIEAARAGDSGRGFSVVADEVRKLAEKSMRATSDVEKSILSIQNHAVESTKTMDYTVEAINKTTEEIQNAGEALKGIVKLSISSASEISTIATAAEEQAMASKEINTTVSESSHLAQNLASSMVDASNIASDVSTQSALLRNIVNEIKNT